MAQQTKRTDIHFLIYGHRGWIGSHIVDNIKKIQNASNSEYNIKLSLSKNRVSNHIEVEAEIKSLSPTHIISALGRTHGTLDDGTKITTIDVHPKLALSSEPFRDSKTYLQKDLNPVNQPSSTENIIPGVDTNIFEQFRGNLNLNPAPDSPDFPDSDPAQNNSANLDLVKEAYSKTDSTSAPENFSEELDEAENVKVTLSEDVKHLHDEIIDGGTEEVNNNESSESNDEDVTETLNTSNENKVPERKLGAGEEALEMLTRKHQALNLQSDSSANEEQLFDYDDDLFADELIPLPGDETLLEPQNDLFSDDNNFASPMESFTLEEGDENLGSSLKNTLLLDEKKSEAEALLKLATTACEAGRMEEAKASLNNYLELLNELDQEPSQDVKQLVKKLELEADPLTNVTNESNTSSTKEETVTKLKPLLKDVPEQTNYANVMDGIVKLLEEKESYEEALPLLKDLLNYNRQRVNISAMDPLYDRIEQAHSSLKNDEDLVSTYKEHLSIKQQLDDLEGELHLLDLISYYYANTGDQKASERYQAESKRIKEKLDSKMAREEYGV